MVVQRTQEIIKITSRLVDHLAMIINTQASRRRTDFVFEKDGHPGPLHQADACYHIIKQKYQNVYGSVQAHMELKEKKREQIIVDNNWRK